MKKKRKERKRKGKKWKMWQVHDLVHSIPLEDFFDWSNGITICVRFKLKKLDKNVFYVFGQYDFGVRILTYYDRPGFENIKILNQDVSKGFLLFQNSTGISLSVNVWHHMCTAIDIKNAKMWNVWVFLL